MKRFLLVFCCIFLLLAGCGDAGGPGSTPGGNISPELRELCKEYLDNRISDFVVSWSSTPLHSDIEVTDYNITDMTLEGDGITVTVELYGDIFINPVTFEEFLEHPYAYYPARKVVTKSGILFGSSVVQLRNNNGYLEAVSCDHDRLSQPALDYLKARAEELEPELAASEKVDVSRYDPFLVEYIRQVIFAHRYIEKAEDITLYDLEKLRVLELPHSGDHLALDTGSSDFELDASMLRLIPNLESITCPYRLTDYSIFENMYQLESLLLENTNDDTFRTLKVGHVNELILYNPDTDMLDLSGADVDILRIFSSYTSVRGFKGCETIEKLYIRGTRTDMRLVNAGTFPGLSYLNLIFNSDYPRVRDFSQLATFKDVKIDLLLEYQACNNPTLESLRGIKLHDFCASPCNGMYPLPDIDFDLINSFDTRSTTVLGREDYFEMRTGNEEPPEVLPAVFSAGPDGEKVLLYPGDTIGGWTMHSFDAINWEDKTTSAQAVFYGNVTLKGAIYLSEDEMPLFVVADESLHLMPCFQEDLYSSFSINNSDIITQAAGKTYGEFLDCEITISRYIHNFGQTLPLSRVIVAEVHKIE